MQGIKSSRNYTRRYTKPSLDESIKPYSKRITGIHPACNQVADIRCRDFDNLVDSIEADGLLHPIQINEDGLLVDGRCRLCACHVLGKKITDDEIVVTKHCPEAIAQSNIARRHLTTDQKVMKATQPLANERKAALDRKQKGAVKGRLKRSTLDVANPASSKTNQKRKPRTLEAVAKSEGVPRQKLSLAEKLKKKAPDLAGKVEQGEISLSQGLKDAGIKASKRTVKKRVNKKPSFTLGSPTSNKDALLFSDELTQVIERADGIRIVRCRDLVIFAHKSVKRTQQVYACKDFWLVGKINDPKMTRVKSKEVAEQLALRRLRKEIDNAKKTDKPV